MSRVPAKLAIEVRLRAADRCEYCQLPAIATQASFEVEHIIPKKHGGETLAENLALACLHCNRHKGTNVSGIARPGGKLVRLFHPRVDQWDDHFNTDNGHIHGRTKIGKVTVDVLTMNGHLQVGLRRLWFDILPP